VIILSLKVNRIMIINLDDKRRVVSYHRA